MLRELTVNETVGCWMWNGVVSLATLPSALGDRGDPQVARQAGAGCPHLLPHGTAVPHDAPGPLQYPVALRREPLKTGPAVDQQDTQRLLQLLEWPPTASAG